MANSTPNQRPPLLRGNTVPLYMRPSQSASAADADAPQQSLAVRPGAYPTPGGSRVPDPFARRDAPPPLSAGPHSNGRYPLQAQWQVPPTPPLSTSPGSVESYYDERGGSSTSTAGAMRYARSHGGIDPQMGGQASPTTATSPASFELLRGTRKPRPPAAATAPMRVETTPGEHILSARIGPGFDSSCITIALRKGNILDIVADRWDVEDCPHEWHVQFDRDADMSGIDASYNDGILTVRVKRLSWASLSSRPPQVWT